MNDVTTQSRRQFLQKAALGGALAGATVSLPVWANTDKLEFPDDLPEWMRMPGAP
ncbi:MAG: sulfite dehydrogenase, partial [Gammaproteobacteria bacterium]